MKSLFWLITVALLTAFGAVSPRVAADVIEIDPDSYAAIAFSPTKHTYSWAYNYEDRETAEQEAISANAGKDAKAVGWVNNGFLALALADNDTTWGTGYSAGGGAGNREAERNAREECNKHSTKGDAFIVLILSSDGQLFKERKRPEKKKDQPKPQPDGTNKEKSVPEAQAFEKKIAGLLKGLEYSDAVAADFIEMVRPWQCEAMRLTPLPTSQDAEEQKLFADEYAQVEEETARQLAGTIVKHIGNTDPAVKDGWKSFDLASVVKDKKTKCLGYVELFYVLANAIGLQARPVDVLEISDGKPRQGEGHLACLVDLQNGKSVQVDLLAKEVVGKPFVFAQEYKKSENYCELNDAENRLQLHRRIQVLDGNGLLAAVDKNRGNVFCVMGRFDQAMPYFNKAVALNPRYSSAYYNRGTAYYNLRQMDKALADLNKAIELNPKYADAYGSRGTVWNGIRQPNKALADLNKAIELNPEAFLAYLNRGNAYNALHKPNEAVADFTKAIELNPRFEVAYYNRANAYKTLGQPLKAIVDYTRAIEINPKYAFAYSNRGATYRAIGQLEKAVADYDKALELNPKDPYAYCNRANAYIAAKQWEKGLADYAKSIELNPGDANTYHNRGIAYFGAEKWNEAVADFTRAIELNPKHALAYSKRGIAKAKQGDAEGAKSDLRQSIRLDPRMEPAVKKSAAEAHLDL